MDIEKQKNRPQSDEFFRLLMNSQKVIYAYILSMVHNCPDADDIMQETMTLMWERFDEFEPGTNFGAWGVKIARFKVLKHYKSKAKTEELFDESLLNQVSDCYHRKMDEMKIRVSALQECLKKLDKRDKKLVRIRYEQGMKITELAAQIDRPVQGLYKALARIHAVLHRCVNVTVRQWGLR